MPTERASLREQREALGLSLDEVAEATAIPVDYLRALEDGATTQLPPGPYARAYDRTVRRCLARAAARRAEGRTNPLATDPDAFPSTPASLSLPTAEGGERPAPRPVVVSHPVPPPRGGGRLPLRWARRAAIVATLGFVGVAGWQGVEAWHAVQAVADTPVVPVPVVVRVQLRTNATLRVEVDGRLEAHRVFAGGEEATFTADREVRVSVPDLEAARIWFDGHPVAPRGHQDRARTLVFVGDREMR